MAIELNENASDQDLKDMIKEADTNCDGGVDIEEFIELMKKAKLIWYISIGYRLKKIK